MALSLRHVADQLFSEVRIAKEKHGHCECLLMLCAYKTRTQCDFINVLYTFSDLVPFT